jgi:hypothetical protein
VVPDPESCLAARGATASLPVPQVLLRDTSGFLSTWLRRYITLFMMVGASLHFFSRIYIGT